MSFPGKPMKRERVALFGGTFNPVHLGHLHLARACRAEFHFDRILFLPTNLPPHKAAPQLASNADRLAMLELALEEEPGFEPCDIEYRMGGKSYTVHTLAYLLEQNPQADYYWLIGADMLFTFREWFEWEKILSMANLIVGVRQEAEFEKLCRERETYGKQAGRIFLLHCPPEEVSSTQIRRALQQGEDVSRWLPRKVERYIKEHRLYAGRVE